MLTMCDLTSCDFLGSYDTNFTDDIIDEFYNPALSNSISYDRMSGYFTSGSLSLAARGIVNLIKNEGKMRVLTSPVLSKSDVEAINLCLNDEELNEHISSIMLESIDVDFFLNHTLEALGWMLSHGYLEIRVILVRNNGMLLTSSQIDGSGIFHNKVGIMKDNRGNVLSFSGSINECYSGWVKNTESFEVFCSWETGSEKHIQPHMDRFEQYWELGHCGHSQTVSLPEAVKNKWIKTIPSKKEDLKIFRETGRGIILRDYQKTAIENWASNEYRGIYNMATGTGKTITAVFAIKDLIERLRSKYLLVIAVPNQHLIPEPWIKSLENYLFNEESNTKIIEAFSGNRKWAEEISDAKLDLRLDIIDSICIVTTYDTLSSDRFIELIESTSGKKILVADEVHNAGANTFRTGLLEDYDFRLGLSATPARYLDDDGTQYIIDYFDKEVFSFTLKEAIIEINPDTGKTYLTPYYYYPIFVSLDESELEEYSRLSKKIARLSSKDELEHYERKQLESLLIKRSRIGKNARNKMEALENIVPELKEKGFFDHCLVYCSDGKDPEDSMIRSLNNVIEILNDNKIPCRRFTSEDAFSTRSQILEDFAEGNVSVLVAIKCLDEGVDVPATKNAIIMASTGNPREYIQRRGRILRPSPGKEYATLYDFMIVPSGSENYRDAEHQLFNNEYNRFKEFSEVSLNKIENEIIIGEVISKFNIELSERE